MTAVKDLVRGSGGGGKGGGGSASAPVEDPNSLRSIQYARVLDLLSEGEIGGLVDGLKTVYLDNTPVMNEDGSLNFTGVTLIERTGTQSQSAIPGFNAAEAEMAVTTQVKASMPVVRSISNTLDTAVRVTLSVPALTLIDTSSGNMHGNLVEIAIDIQNNGGGFIAQPLGHTQDVSKLAIAAPGAVMLMASVHIQLTVQWTGLVSTSPQSCTMQLNYRVAGSGGSWITATTYTFSGTGKYVTDTSGAIFNSGSSVLYAPTARKALDVNVPYGTYEFTTVITSGSGIVSIKHGHLDVPVFTDVISGKTTSKYQRSYRLALPSPGPWDIRVRRITADNVLSNIQNDTWWDSLTEIVDANLRYPNSAVYGLEVDASQFNAVPTRGYEVFGIKIQIPSNYDPLLRTYTGSWDGTFVTAWSNNPAWVFYDICTSERYGLGAWLSPDQNNKWALYAIAKYCDELVDDGFGGKEPRFTCNIYLQSAAQAFQLLSSLASVFRAITFWSGGTITAVQDAPSTPIALFTAANVVGGQFSYQGSSARARHTVAIVTWNDPNNAYTQVPEYVSDDDGITRYGVNTTTVVAMGCTSRGQAHRFGKAILYTELMETEIVSFRTGLEGTSIYPGGIIDTLDPIRAGKRFGGRVISATTVAVTIDAPVIIEAGKTYSLNCMLPDGSFATAAVTNSPGSFTTLNLAIVLPSAPLVNSIWLLAASDLIPQSWRVIGLVEVDGVQVDVTAMSYRSDKYDAIEKNLVLEPLPVSSVSYAPSASPVGLTIAESLYQPAIGIVAVKAFVSCSPVPGASSYVFSYQKGSDNPVQVQRPDPMADIEPIAEGDYTFSVYTTNSLGVRSPKASVAKTIYGKNTLPVDVTNFNLVAISGTAHLSFDTSPDLDVIVGGYMHIRHTSNVVSPTWSSAVDIGPSIPGTASSAVLPLVSGTYLAKWVDSSGNESQNADMIITTAPDVLSMNAVSTITENPAWSGAKSNVAYDGILGGIKLDSASTIDAMATSIDTWGFIDAIGGISTYGEYLAAGSVDLGAVFTSRLTASILTSSFDSSDLIDSRTAVIDTWADIDGSSITDALVALMVRTTNDNPGGSPTWSAWQPFIVGDWTARAFQFKAVFTTGNATHNVVLKSMSVTVDMPDRFEIINNIVSGAGPHAVTYSMPFMGVKGLGITAKNMQTGDYYTITGESQSGYSITFNNSVGAAISRIFDSTTVGYGHG